MMESTAALKKKYERKEKDRTLVKYISSPAPFLFEIHNNPRRVEVKIKTKNPEVKLRTMSQY